MSIEINSEYDIYENFKQGNKFDLFDKKTYNIYCSLPAEEQKYLLAIGQGYEPVGREFDEYKIKYQGYKPEYEETIDYKIKYRRDIPPGLSKREIGKFLLEEQIRLQSVPGQVHIPYGLSKKEQLKLYYEARRMNQN